MMYETTKSVFFLFYSAFSNVTPGHFYYREINRLPEIGKFLIGIFLYASVLSIFFFFKSCTFLIELRAIFYNIQKTNQILIKLAVKKNT